MSVVLSTNNYILSCIEINIYVRGDVSAEGPPSPRGPGAPEVKSTPGYF
jgi:hypothetical protein